MTKVLNLYAGIGGNRRWWDRIPNLEITAVEIDPQIASIYKDFFPNDDVKVEDAHEYLLKHFEEFDFIWASPPCPTHSKIRYVRTFVDEILHPANYSPPIYPDMRLYQEILLLQGYAKCKWVIENVISWYEPLIRPQEIGRHYYWANFNISGMKVKASKIADGTNEELKEVSGFDLCNYESVDKKLLLRNCVEPNVGLEILECALKEKQKGLIV